MPERPSPEASVPPSFVIAAHDEERVIGACVEALLRQGVAAERIVVVPNGCSDRTADTAAGYDVVVVDRPEPGKAGALNAGDAVAPAGPRVYLDADIVVPAGGVAALVARLEATPPVQAVVPGRRLNTAGRPLAVRAYSAISGRLPAFRTGLFGRGMIMLSEAGRARFGAFPEMVADDLFLDSQFSSAEKASVDSVVVVVEAPYTTRELLNRLVRVRRGNAQMRAAATAGEVEIDVRPSDRWAWLKVALARPWLLPAAVVYFSLTLIATRRARRSTGSAIGWGQDAGSRERAAMHSRGAAS
jgi:glycosyltransferase involved in cell wall biosynthesis